MRIAKPLLLISTPIGLIAGLYECYRLAGGLIFLMAAMLGVMGVALASVLGTIRREATTADRQPVGRSEVKEGVWKR